VLLYLRLQDNFFILLLFTNTVLSSYVEDKFLLLHSRHLNSFLHELSLHELLILFRSVQLCFVHVLDPVRQTGLNFFSSDLASVAFCSYSVQYNENISFEILV